MSGADRKEKNTGPFLAEKDEPMHDGVFENL
jgi:hypothetical protein